MRWYSMSVGFLQDPKVEQLGERHGAAGPLVIVDLLSAAALAGGEKGEFQRSFRTISIGAHTDREEAEAIIDSAVEIGLVTEMSRDGHGVSLAFPEWKKWQQNGRKAKSRESQKEPGKPHHRANVTRSHRPVTDMSPTDRQTDRQTKTTTARARDLHSHQPVLSKLDAVAFARNTTVAVPAAAQVCDEYSHLDLEAEAAKFAHYWTEGPKAKEPISDVVWRWRGWLERAKPSEPKRAPAAERFAAYDAVMEPAS